MRATFFLLLLVPLFGPHTLPAEESWPGFRGPSGNGHSTSKQPPTKWTETDNIRWKTAIHGRGWSSPVVLGEQIWVTTADEVMGDKQAPKKGDPARNPVKQVSLFAMCLDRESGKVVHDIKLRTEDNPAFCHPFNTYASPTPFVEEGRLYAHFGSHGTFCIDTASGKVVWERLDLKCDHFRGPASSPVVHGDLLFLIFDGFDEQYVVALDKKSGKTKWKTERNIKYGTDNGDFKKAYATPAVFTVGEKEWLVCPSAVCTIAYDPKSGEELWRFTHGGMNGSARPVMADGLLYLTSGSSGKLFALKADELSGNVDKSAIAWEISRDVCIRSSLLLVDGLLFMVSDTGVATCLDAKTGKRYWHERLDGEYSASPIVAGGNVYFCGQVGKTYLVKAAREFTEVAENRLARDSAASPPGFMASPAMVKDELYLRTTTHLYCIK